VSGPKGVGGKVRVKTQMGWGMGQCPDPKGVGGLDPWSDPKGSGVGGWGLGIGPCLDPRGLGSSVSEPKGGWDLCLCPDPRRLGLCPDPRGLGFGSFDVGTQ